MILAILRAQILSMMRIGRGSVLGIIMLAVWYALWTAGGVVACVTFRYLEREQLAIAVPLTLAAMCAYWQLVPIVSASVGASLDMRKLLAYPVPREQLFLVEVLLRLTTAIEMMLLLSGLAFGLYLNQDTGGIRPLPKLIAVLVIFVLFNLLLAAGAGALLERLLARRHVREIFAIVVTMVWVLPRFLASTGVHADSLKTPGAILQFALLPWTAAARAALGVSVGSSLLYLGVWLAVAYWFGRSQFERGLHYDAVAAQATTAQASKPQRGPWTERLYRWPALLWRDPLAAIVEKELRSLARNPRFRMVFIMGFTFGLFAWFPIFVRHRDRTIDSPYFLVVVCMYSLAMLGQASFWNCFGFDRGAAAFYFAAPPTLYECLAGKNIAALVFILLETVILAGVMVALGLTRGWSMLESLVAISVAALYMLAAGNINSVRYARAANAERLMQGNSGGRSPGVVFLLYMLTLIPIALAYLARFAFNSEIAFLLVLGAAAAGGVVLYRNAMQSAVAWATAKREQLLAELSKGGGPVVVD